MTDNYHVLAINMCKMYFFHFTVVIVICAGITETVNDQHILRINRIPSKVETESSKKLLNDTVEREKRTLLYLVPKEVEDENKKIAQNSTNSPINTSTNSALNINVQIPRISNQNSWSANNRGTFNENAQRAEDQYLASPSNRISTTIEHLHKMPFSQAISIKDPRDTLKSILLSKYPNQKNNIENLFTKIKGNWSNRTAKSNFSLLLNKKLENSIKRKRSKNYSSEIEKPSASQQVYYVQDSNKLTPLLVPYKNTMEPLIVPQSLDKNSNKQQVYKIAGQAFLPVSSISESQQSKINIPFASNVNFDQRIFLLNKNPYFPAATDNQQLSYMQYPYAVSAYNLLNPNGNANKGNIPRKFLCIRKSKGDNIGQKLFDENECIKLYSKELCSSQNSNENCDNLDGSIPMEFDDGNHDLKNGVQVSNLVNILNKQNELSNPILNPSQNMLTAYPNPVINNPYLISNQHLFLNMPPHGLYNTLFKTPYSKQFNDILPSNNKLFLCHTINDDGIIVEVNRCENRHEYFAKGIKQQGRNETKIQASSLDKNNSSVKPELNFNAQQQGKESSKQSNLKNNETASSTFVINENQMNNQTIKDSMSLITNRTTSKEPSVKVHNFHSNATPIKTTTQDVANKFFKRPNSTYPKTYKELIARKQNVNGQKDHLTTNIHSENVMYDIIYANSHDSNNNDKNSSKITTEKPTTYRPITPPIYQNKSTAKPQDSLYRLRHQNLTIENKTTGSKSAQTKPSTSINTENIPLSLPYNLTMLDLSNFPCTKHLVTTATPAIHVTSSFKIKPFLKTIIKQVINEFSSKTSHKTLTVYKVKDIEIENSSEAYLHPTIIDTPILKNLFRLPQVETLLVNNVKKFLSKIVDLSNFVDAEIINEKLIRSEIKNFVEKMPMSHPTVATHTLEEKHKHDNDNRDNVLTKSVTEMDVPSIFLLSTLHNMMRQSNIGKQALRNEVVQNVIVKTVKNSLVFSKNSEKNRIKESEIKDALNYLMVSDFGSKLLSDIPTTSKNTDKENSNSSTTTQIPKMNPIKPQYLQNLKNKETTTENMDHIKYQHLKQNYESNLDNSEVHNNQELHDQISSTLKSLKSTDHHDSKSMENKEIRDILDSIEKHPIKYYSQTDRILKYIKDHRKSNNEPKNNNRNNNFKYDVDSKYQMQNSEKVIKQSYTNDRNKTKSKSRSESDEKDYTSTFRQNTKDISDEDESNVYSNLKNFQQSSIKAAVNLKTTKPNTEITTPKIRYVLKKITIRPKFSDVTSSDENIQLNSYEGETVISKEIISINKNKQEIKYQEDSDYQDHGHSTESTSLYEKSTKITVKSRTPINKKTESYSKLKFSNLKQKAETRQQFSDNFSKETDEDVTKTPGFKDKLLMVSNEEDQPQEELESTITEDYTSRSNEQNSEEIKYEDKSINNGEDIHYESYEEESEEYKITNSDERTDLEEKFISDHFTSDSTERVTSTMQDQTYDETSYSKKNTEIYSQKSISHTSTEETKEEYSKFYEQNEGKNQKFEGKLFTISNENINEDEETPQYDNEENSTTLTPITTISGKSRIPRTTEFSAKSNKEKIIKRTQRTTNPSTIYDDNDDDFYAYSTSTAISVETPIYDEYSADVTIPNAYEINTKSGIKSQGPSSNDYNTDDNGPSVSEDATPNNYDYSKDNTDSVEKYPEALKYNQQSTDIIEKYTTRRRESTPKKYCNHKSEEDDVTIDITKINEEFSTTPRYPSYIRNLNSNHDVDSKNKVFVYHRTVQYDDNKREELKESENGSHKITVRMNNERTTQSSVITTTDKNPLFIGKLYPKEPMNYMDNVDLFYVGDGVKLPLTIKRQLDGSFSLSLSDNICELILKRKCSYGEASEERNSQYRDRKRRRNYTNKDGRRKRARRSNEPFRIISGDGLDIDFHHGHSSNFGDDGSRVIENVNIDDVPDIDRKDILLNAQDNLMDLKQNEIDDIINEAKDMFAKDKSSGSR